MFPNLNFHPLKVVSPYRDPQLQVVENYSYLFNLRTKICKTFLLNTHLIPNNSDLAVYWNKLETINTHD